MEERATGTGASDGRAARGAAKSTRTGPASRPRPTVKPTVDKFPKHPEEWKAFVVLPADERAAVYLRSIRSMMLFFTVLTVIGIVTTIVLVLIGVNAANDTTTVNTNPFG